MARKTIQVNDTNIVEISDNITGIETVRVKTNSSNKFFSEVSIYEIFGNNVVLQRKYPVVEVVYNFSSEQERELRLSKTKLNKDLEDLIANTDVTALTKSMNQLKEQFAAREGSNFVEIDKTLAGFKSIATPMMENIKTTAEKIPVIITPNAVKALATSSEKTAIDAITGTSSSNGAPNVTVVAGTSKGVSSVYQGSNPSISASPSEIKGAVKGVSPLNVAIDEKKVLEVVQSLAGTTLATAQSKFLTSANKKATEIAPETSYANILPGLLAGSKGFSNAVGFGSSQGGLHHTLPNLIEGPIKLYNTNTSENSLQIGLVGVEINKTSIIENLGGGITTFGSADHIFSIVDTEEELVKEINNIKRDITSAVVHWSHTWANQFLNAADIDKIHRAQQKKKMGVEAYTLANTVQQAGIMWHYCILKDGTLQRGRPIELKTVDEMPFAERAIHIGFVAGYDVHYSTQVKVAAQATPDSITQKQWETFDLLSKTLLNSKPGIGILGHNDIHNASTCPGFDVEAYLERRFGYVSPYDEIDLESPDALTYLEMINKTPTEIAIPSPSIESIDIDMEFLSLENTNKDPTTGLPIASSQTEINTALSDYENQKAKISNLNTQFSTKAQDVVLNNNYYDQKRTVANDALYNLREDRKPSEEQAAEYRKILINAGYIYDERTKSWQTR